MSLEELVGEDSPIVYGIIQAGPEVAGGVPYVRPTELVNGGIDFSGLKRTSKAIAQRYERATLRAGDIILAIVGTIGKLAIVPPELDGANITQSSARVRPPAGMPPQYLAAVLKSPQVRKQFDEMEFGVAVRRLNIAHVRALKIPVPPLNEQRRIVAKLETLQARSRRAREALDGVPPLLEKLRQSILAAAFRGDLTKDWRAKHKDVEPAGELLKRIRVERRKNWEHAELTKMRGKGKAPTDDKWKAKYKEPAPVNTTGLPELPGGWCWASMEACSSLVTDGDHNPPKRVPTGVPHLTAKNIKNQQLRFEGCSYVTEAGFAQTRQRYEPRAGDVIVTCVGTLGETAIVPADVSFSADRNLAAIRLVEGGVVAPLLQYWLNTLWVQRHLGIVSGSTAQPHLYLNDLRALAVPIMPSREQHAVVTAISDALARVADVTSRTASVEKAHGALERAVLAKAFCGQLVPENANDEPAEAMLARPCDVVGADARVKVRASTAQNKAERAGARAARG